MFDRELFTKLCRSRGWEKDADRARALEVRQSTIHRIQSGEQQPSLKFANKCRQVFGLENYVRLFPLTNAEETSDVSS